MRFPLVTASYRNIAILESNRGLTNGSAILAWVPLTWRSQVSGTQYTTFAMCYRSPQNSRTTENRYRYAGAARPSAVVDAAVIGQTDQDLRR